MNSQKIHYVLMIIITIVSGLASMDLTPFFSPETALKVVSALGIIKLVLSSIRDASKSQDQ